MTDVPVPVAGATRADGESVRFAGLPTFLGPVQFARQLPRIAARLRGAASHADALILRLPSGIGAAAGITLLQPYGVEVVADPFDAFSPGAAAHPLRPIARIMLTQFQRMLCHRAAAAAYVTAGVLQKRYP